MRESGGRVAVGCADRGQQPGGSVAIVTLIRHERWHCDQDVQRYTNYFPRDAHTRLYTVSPVAERCCARTMRSALVSLVVLCNALTNRPPGLPGDSLMTLSCDGVL